MINKANRNMLEDNKIRLEINGHLTIGVISDTHVPDRAVGLHPELVKELRRTKVDLIFHAGDISTPRVLHELGQIAPIHAVRGNRDWFQHPQLKRIIRLEIGNKQLVLLHGHGPWINYLWDKFMTVLAGYRYERYLRALGRQIHDADIVIFGHTHQPENRGSNGQVIINPGSASLGANGTEPGFGILEMDHQGMISYRWQPLRGWCLSKRVWRKLVHSG